MNLAAFAANSAWLAAAIPSWHRFRNALKQPAEAQEKLLLRLLANNANSIYGLEHGFGQIHSYADFAARVPIVDYDNLKPWITRILRGGESLLTSGRVTHLIPTSGTSAARKLIPFTGALQREFNAAINPWLVDLCKQHPEIARGTAYWAISPALGNEKIDEQSKVPVGFEDDSSYLGGLRKKLAGVTFAVPPEIRMARDIETFRYLTLLSLLRREDLTFVSVWHPSFLSLLLDALPGLWDELLRDIESGGCKYAADLPTPMRRAFHARPMLARKRELFSADPSNPQTLWPDLKAVSCWGDAQSALPMADLQRRLPGVALQAKGLLATEAFVSIPFQKFHPLAITSHFFEFSGSDEKIYRAHELQRGEIYSVIVTTAGGLWRYRLGDLVRVEDFLEGTPSVRFIWREGNVSDLCGEKLSGSFVSEIIGTVCSRLNCQPVFAMLAPDSNTAGSKCYTLFIEGVVPREITAAMESELRKNPHYDLCRSLGQLGPLRCFRIANGGYETFAQAGIANGARLGDIKPQALSALPDWARKFTGNYI